jgi:ubiquinone/menaquinone biosynthesis C-methylase UbiE
MLQSTDELASPKREESASWRSYSRLVTGNLLNLHAFERATARALAHRFGHVAPDGRALIEDCHALEVGCGFCGHLITLQRFGVQPHNLHGVDLRKESIESAQARFPLLQLIVGDARQLPYADHSFDIITQNVCFTSILDEEDRLQVAREMMRVLKPGGVILWFDFRYNNPHNRSVRKVGHAQLRTYFPGMHMRVRSILLFPWLARCMVSTFWAPVFHLCYAFLPLRTHLFAELSWK